MSGIDREPESRSPRGRRRWIPLSLVATLLLSGLWVVWESFFRTEPDPYARAPLGERFLYGSIGTEGREGMPYWIWLVLPRVFEDLLPGPGGYASLGMSWEEGAPMPMGFTLRRIGYQRVGLNCAACHTSQLRLSEAQSKPDFYPAGPSHQFWVQGYQRFLARVAFDPRFQADRIMEEIASIQRLSLRERLLYRYVLIPLTRRALRQRADAFSWQKERPDHGPGRVDPFNPMKFGAFGIEDDGSIGNADIPSIWNQEARRGAHLHWDGLSRDFFEVAVSSAIGDGARGSYLDAERLMDVEAFLSEARPPAYPLAVDASLAERGRSVYRSHCAGCHAADGERTGEVIPLSEVGTDPHRTRAWTEAEVEAWKALAGRYRRDYGAGWNLATFGKREGYVATPLDGLWLRGPYLHNGSVPNLKALLDPVGRRPPTFYRGYDLFDGEAVGFVSDRPEWRGRRFFLFDTSLAGNGNGGHVYGTELPADEKRALIEFLKTL